jgi:hypothetical protein
LAVGEHVIIDPRISSGCLRLPAAGNDGALYLLVLASTSGVRTSSGVQGPYLLRASSPQAGIASAPEAGAAATVAVEPGSGASHSAAAQFDAVLRERERELLAQPGGRLASLAAPGVAAAPPIVGDSKTFQVCTSLQCNAFVSVPATARFVGQHVAIFMDNTVADNDPLQIDDFAELGAAFDTYHFPIDTTAFGRESDLDGNGVVIMLMTNAVNDLTPNCNNGRVVGYFFGGDLLTGPNSNRGEVFYTLVPAPATPNCSVVTRRIAVDNLKPTLIHEFQHMISFNQHGLVRGGNAEETWLNEALSHFAEELGGRLIPNPQCTPGFVSCRSQYTGGDITNSYDFLKNPEAHFLVFPSSSSGTLGERGAGWLFLRWVVDHFASDTILAAGATRTLVNTNLTGMNNIVSLTGTSAATMIPEWLMASYLDDGSDLPEEPTGRLRFKSWGLRTIWTDPRNAALFPNGFPVIPEVIVGTFSRSGTLLGGSGRHFTVVQSALGAPIDVQVLKSSAGAQVDAALQARFGIVRIR